MQDEELRLTLARIEATASRTEAAVSQLLTKRGANAAPNKGQRATTRKTSGPADKSNSKKPQSRDDCHFQCGFIKAVENGTAQNGNPFMRISLDIIGGWFTNIFDMKKAGELRPTLEQWRDAKQWVCIWYYDIPSNRYRNFFDIEPVTPGPKATPLVEEPPF